ncbi:MAG: hypothetical protein HC933_19205, partial [Pleurocapsa sp. SU_196_0]|nr:hypothetical protein [Pleurocapsa sp. SU_196_0]
MILGAISFLWLYPIFWVIAAAFKNNAEVFTSGANLIPQQPVGWENFVRAWNVANFSQYFGNSVIYGVGAVIVAVVLLVMLGDVLAGLLVVSVIPLSMLGAVALMQRFGERYHVEPIPSRRHAVDALLRIYYQWRGNYGKLPDIAIVDWAGVPTTSEFNLFVNYFAEHGFTATICTPDDLEFRNGKMS